MARALLNCGCLAVSRTANLRDDNNSPIFLLGYHNNDTCAVELWLFHVRRQQNLPKNFTSGAAPETLAPQSTSRPAVLLC